VSTQDRTEGIHAMTPLSEGAEAPDFTLESDSGETVSLAQLRGKPVVLYFYPRDDTPGCTTEACEFRDAWDEVKKTGAVVLGVSPDTAASHQKFKSKFKLPFPLLADPDHKVAERYGAWGERSMYGRKFQGILRTTFVIGADGRIRKVFERVKPKGHAAQVLDTLH
jgi:peroxiredoxin Q/BCP